MNVVMIAIARVRYDTWMLLTSQADRSHRHLDVHIAFVHHKKFVLHNVSQSAQMRDIGLQSGPKVVCLLNVIKKTFKLAKIDLL